MTKWRELEKLVSVIEDVLSPVGAVVTHDDKIVDKITGMHRQVDASVKFSVDSTPVLLTIECRRHVPKDKEKKPKKQDVTWIEQLVTKMRDIGAETTIAVSSSGFTKPAIIKAREYRILVRELKEINEESIRSWLYPKAIEFVIYHCTLTQLIINDELTANAQVILQYSNGKRLSMYELLEQSLKKPQFINILNRQPKDNTENRSQILHRVPKGDLYLETEKGLLDVFSLKLEIYHFAELIQKPLPKTNHFIYQDYQEVLAYVSQFKIELEDSSTKANIIKHKDTELAYSRGVQLHKLLIGG